MPLWLSFVFLAIGILAIYIEIFVPAAGLIGLAGGGLIVAGIVLAYANHGPINGTIVLFTSLVVTPVAFVVGMKAFPHTPVGKRLILGMPGTTSKGNSRGTADRPDPPDGPDPDLVGQEGTALTDLRPSGMARVGGTKMSVLTEGEYLSAGSQVRIVRAEGNRLFVREVG